MKGNDKFRNPKFKISEMVINNDEHTKNAWRKLAIAILSQLLIDCSHNNGKSFEQKENWIDDSYLENICQLASVPPDNIKTMINLLS